MSIEKGAGATRSNRTARAVGGHGERFGAVAAVDFDGVEVRAPFIQIRVIAGIPNHPIVARLAKDLIVGVAASQDVIAVTAEQQIDSSLAEQRVVAGLAEDLVPS